MRHSWCVLLGIALAGCAELGVVGDGTSVSVGKPYQGYLVDGARIPDRGEGFLTRDVWKKRNNRYGTDEVVDLVTAVARRMATRVHDVSIVVGDLSGPGGGGGTEFHRSHQSGRDVDLIYYMRDTQGKPFEPDAMHVFDQLGKARDGSGLTVDVARTWLLVKELISAPEACVQYIFIYEPIAKLLIEHAEQANEPADIVDRARRTMHQPGDSARHDDHMHVRVYCSAADKRLGCVDTGPLDLARDPAAELALDVVRKRLGAGTNRIDRRRWR